MFTCQQCATDISLQYKPIHSCMTVTFSTQSAIIHEGLSSMKSVIICEDFLAFQQLESTLFF